MKSLKYLVFILVISFLSLSSVYAEVCIYRNDNLEVRCNEDNNTTSGVTCSFIGANVNYVDVIGSGESTRIVSVTKRTFDNAMTLKRDDFLNSNEEFDCSELPNLYIDYNTISSNTTIEVYDMRSNNSCIYNEQVYEYNDATTYFPGSDTRGCKAYSLSNSNSGSNTGNEGENSGESSGQNQNDDEFNVDTFCTGTVQGVFTTIGWVFFFAKIIIPIILIVFGSIDLGKAVVASKDDEIKKSVKTLVIRAIAGIIIFFIPTILSFIVSWFDNDNVYNGTFGDCTQCMLDPNHVFEDGSVCRRLIGGD